MPTICLHVVRYADPNQAALSPLKLPRLRKAHTKFSCAVCFVIFLIHNRANIVPGMLCRRFLRRFTTARTPTANSSALVQAAASRFCIPKNVDVFASLTAQSASTPALHFALADGGVRTLAVDVLQRAASALADRLSELGVRRGDRVAVMLPKIPELVATGLAIWKLGATYVPLFTAFGPDALAQRVRDASVRVIITDTANAPKLAEMDASVRGAIKALTVAAPPSSSPPPAGAASGALGGATFTIDSLISEARTADAAALRAGAPMSPHETLALLFTSGTTGMPKAVDIPVRALASFEVYLRHGVRLQAAHEPGAEAQRYFCTADAGWVRCSRLLAGLHTGRCGSHARNFASTPRICCHTTTLRPLFLDIILLLLQAYGLYYNLLGPLLLGVAPLYLQAHFSADVALRAMAQHRITHYTSAPTAYRLLKATGGDALAQHRDAIAAHLRTASSAGEPLNPEVVTWWEKSLGLPIGDHYGQTETGMLINVHWGDRRGAAATGGASATAAGAGSGSAAAVDGAVWCRPGSMGRSMPGIRAVVLDGEGREVLGQPGEVAIDTAHSPMLWFRGYYGNAAKTAERFVGAPAPETADEAAAAAAVQRPTPRQIGRYYLTGDVATHFSGGTEAAVAAAEAAGGFGDSDSATTAAHAAAAPTGPVTAPAATASLQQPAVERFWFRSRADDVITSAGESAS